MVKFQNFDTTTKKRILGLKISEADILSLNCLAIVFLFRFRGCLRTNTCYIDMQTGVLSWDYMERSSYIISTGGDTARKTKCVRKN